MLGASPASAATDDVSWTVRTASNALGADRTNFSYALNPGAHLDDGLVVANRGTEAIELDVYAADGYTTSTGAVDLRLAAEQPTGVGKWIAVPQRHVSVPAGQTVEVPFTVDVPADATPGDYAGGVVTSLTVADQSANVNVDRRLGIRAGIRVGGDLVPALSVDDVRVDWDGGVVPFLFGDATVHYGLHNTGNVSLTADDTDAVAGPFGLGRAEAAPDAASPVLLPGETWPRDVRVSGVAAMGLLWASVTATPTVTDASGSITALDPVEASAVGAAVPWPLPPCWCSPCSRPSSNRGGCARVAAAARRPRTPVSPRPSRGRWPRGRRPVARGVSGGYLDVGAHGGRSAPEE